MVINLSKAKGQHDTSKARAANHPTLPYACTTSREGQGATARDPGGYAFGTSDIQDARCSTPESVFAPSALGFSGCLAWASLQRSGTWVDAWKDIYRASFHLHWTPLLEEGASWYVHHKFATKPPAKNRIHHPRVLWLHIAERLLHKTGSCPARGCRRGFQLWGWSGWQDNNWVLHRDTQHPSARGADIRFRGRGERLLRVRIPFLVIVGVVANLFLVFCQWTKKT